MINDTVNGLLEIPEDMSFCLVSSISRKGCTIALLELVEEMFRYFHGELRWNRETQQHRRPLSALLKLEDQEDGLIAYKEGMPVAIQLFDIDGSESAPFGLYVTKRSREQRIGSMTREVLYKYLLKQGVLTFNIGKHGSVFNTPLAQGFAQHDVDNYDGAILGIEKTSIKKWIRSYTVNLIDYKPKYYVNGIKLE